MIGRIILRGLALASLLAVAACAGDTRVVLLPDDDGHVGRVAVSNKAGTQVLDQARQGTTVPDAGTPPGKPALVTDETIARVWGAALSAAPPRPLTFTLYFESGTADLTRASAAELPEIVRQISSRAHSRLMVVGHADAVGSDDINLRISRDRAQKVRGLLGDMGARPEVIEVTSHGKRNPLIKTPDGVAEPRNRRVSVTVQ
jgi:outer membrane protein OmpA-like peptidoglycan-associated protein